MPPNPRVAKAFHAMRDLGISEHKVKPVLKNLLKLYDKNWDLIEEENYRVLADAIFDNEEAEAAQRKKKLENTQEDVLKEEAQEQDETDRSSKRMCLKYQGHVSEFCNNSACSAGISYIRIKDEPVELPEVHPQTQVQSMDCTTPLSDGNRRIESHHAPCKSLDRSIGKQPVSPKSLTIQARTGTSQPVSPNKSQIYIPTKIESVAVPHSMSLIKSVKETLSPHFSSGEKRLESEQSSQEVLDDKTVGDQIMVLLEEEPFNPDMPGFNLPLAVILPETCEGGDSSMKSSFKGVQNGSVPLAAESVGVKDTSDGVPATMPDESSSRLEVASSPLGEVKICLSYNISSVGPGFRVPSLDAVVKSVEDRCLRSYKHPDTNFSLMKLMKDMCEVVLELGFESRNESEERN